MKEPKSRTRNILEWIVCIVIAITIALVFRYYIGNPTKVQSHSMDSTLEEGQMLLLNKYSFRIQKQLPKRGEIVTFEAPSRKYYSLAEAKLKEAKAMYPESKGIFLDFIYHVVELGKENYIKRVIALPGEHVKIQNGKVYVKEEVLQENYLKDELTTTSGCLTDFIVPEGYIFLMGDNRNNSMDSREFGCIPVDKIESKVAIRIWPFAVWGEVH